MNCTYLFRKLPAFVLAGFLLAYSSGYAQNNQTEKQAKNSPASSWLNPGPEFRGKPFWAWNGDLDKDELLRQVHVLKEMGFGGFFMHSRTGLITEYLGKKWFDVTNVCADEAEKTGTEAWLYDEDRWPSGTAGGVITKDPKYRMLYLNLYRVKPSDFKWNDSVIAAFVCDLDGVNYTKYKRLEKGETAQSAGNNTVLQFVIEEMEKSSFYNGYTYINTMDIEPTEEYIRLTHEQYKKKCGDRLGTSIKGIFTDEPNRGTVMAQFGNPSEKANWMTPWSRKFEDKFVNKFGYSLIDRLPELFLVKKDEPVSPVKWSYMELAQELFLDNFEKPLSQWCQENNILLTGHALHEDNLTAQSLFQGSLMRFYEYEQIPGIDVLTEGNNDYWVAKQLSSVARQFDKKWMLSELYGATGWQMNFESYKATGAWQALFGINVRCQHLSWYTMEGEAKRDYPGSIFYQSGWWKEHNYLETYFARLGFVLSQGRPQCELLVINPVESVWAQIHAGWASGLSPKDPAVQELENAYTTLFTWLTESRIDFDYGDEEMIGRLYRIEKDNAGAPVLWINKAPYKTVVVGKMTTIRSSTLKILKEFAAEGGAVIFAGNPPAYVDAVRSEEVSLLAGRTYIVPFDKGQIAAAVEKIIYPPVKVYDKYFNEMHNSIFCQVRKDGNKTYVVLLNTDRKNWYRDCIVKIPYSGIISQWSCETGERKLIDVKQNNGSSEIEADFAPAGTKVYMISDNNEGLQKEENLQKVNSITFNGPFNYKLNEPNVCVIDFASYRIDNGPWSAETEVLKIDRAVRKNFGLAYRSGEMIQPWFGRKYGDKPKEKGTVNMKFRFNIENIPDTLTLCLEHPEYVNIKLNGSNVDYNEKTGWWIDPVFKKVILPKEYIESGKNEIELSMKFDYLKNIEAMYLTGSFGVKINNSERTITSLPAKIQIGDITEQGLPFYTGTVRYEISVDKDYKNDNNKVYVKLNRFEAALAKAVSSETSGIIAWQPHKTEVKIGNDRKLNLDVVLTRRNVFGPLHQVPKNPGVCAPDSYITEGNSFSNDYQLYPSGLLEAPELEIYKIK